MKSTSKVAIQERFKDDSQGIQIACDRNPDFGVPLLVAPGVWWVRLPVGSSLQAINVYLMEDGKGLTLVDTGVRTAECRDALKSCDVIFGCTDDNDGRLLLNRLAYFYLIPVIDMGLAIEPEPAGGGVRELSGRATVLAPGGSCLLCRQIVDPVLARDEDLRRRHPRQPGSGCRYLHHSHRLHGDRRTSAGADQLPRRQRMGLAACAALRPAAGSIPGSSVERGLSDLRRPRLLGPRRR